MAWEVRYRLERAPVGRQDGSGDVSHELTAQAREDGGDWQATGLHKDIVIPWEDVQDALAAGTNQQIIAAYKEALVTNRNRTSVPVVGWSLAEITTRMEQNKASLAQAAAADYFITVTLNKTYGNDTVFTL